MAARLEFHVLNVGQGSGNFVEIFKEESDTVPTTTVLVDLGSERASTSHDGPSVEVVIARLYTMSAPEIACLCLSHSDTDHVSMILQLLAAFNPPGVVDPSGKKKNLTIKKAYYGGNPSLYKKRGKANILTEVGKYMTSGEPYGMPTDTTSYKIGNDPLYRDDTLSLKVMLLIGNSIKAEDEEIDDSTDLPKTGGLNLNTVSLIVVVDWNNVQFITTGDATGITMLRANGIMGNASGSFFGDPLMITAPHHGSLTSAVDFTGQGISEFKDKVAQLDLFARRCGAKILTASAGEVTNFKHPSAYLLNIFWKYCTTEIPYTDPVALTNSHFYTAYYGTDYGFTMTTNGTGPWPTFLGGWFTLQTVVPVFTTDQYVQSHLLAWLDTSKKSWERFMGVLPASAAKPSPGSVTPYPSKTPLPAEEVGWTIRINWAKKYSMRPIVPDAKSIALRHAAIHQADALYGDPAPAKAADAPARTGRPTPPPPAQSAPRPRPAAPGPRPTRR